MKAFQLSILSIQNGHWKTRHADSIRQPQLNGRCPIITDGIKAGFRQIKLSRRPTMVTERSRRGVGLTA